MTEKKLDKRLKTAQKLAVELQTIQKTAPISTKCLCTMPGCVLWIRVRAYAIKGVKMNQKGSHIADLNCRFCDTDVPETQEHLEICAGMEFERWRLDLTEREGQLMFWRNYQV